jgi:hypothetical protein
MCPNDPVVPTSSSACTARDEGTGRPAGLRAGPPLVNGSGTWRRTRRARCVAIVTALVALAFCGVVDAAAPWSPPKTVASGIDAFWHPTLRFTGDGHALAMLDGSGAAPTGLTRVLAAAPGTTAFREIGRTVLIGRPAPYGRHGMAYLRAAAPPRGKNIDAMRSTRLGVSLADAPDTLGRFRPLEEIASTPGDVSARVAADPRGNVAAAWLQPGKAGLAVRVALRRPGHAFGRPQTIGRAQNFGEVNPLDLAYGANGDLVVAFQRTTSVTSVSHRTLRLAVRVKRHGRPFGPIQTLGPLLGSSSISTAIAATGRAVVAWGAQDSGEGIEDPWTVHAAVLRADARRFSRTQLLDPGQVAYPTSAVRAAIGRDGVATVAWTPFSAAGQRYPVRVTTAAPTGRFGAPAQLAINAAVIGVVTAGDGTTTVLWGRIADEEAETLDGIFASSRGRGTGLFGPPEAVSPPHELAVNTVSVDVDPATGQPAALWIGGTVSPGAPPLTDGGAVAPRSFVRRG